MILQSFLGPSRLRVRFCLRATPAASVREAAAPGPRVLWRAPQDAANHSQYLPGLSSDQVSPHLKEHRTDSLSLNIPENGGSPLVNNSLPLPVRRIDGLVGLQKQL